MSGRGMKRFLMRLLGYKEIRVIDRMDFTEVSVVDRPTDPHCVITGGQYAGMGLGVGGRMLAWHMEWRWTAWGLKLGNYIVNSLGL